MEMPPPPERNDMVTASDLVRQFGLWRERALRMPVYILHRGRPRLVLASVELIEMLCRPHDGDTPGDSQRLAALLDGSPDMIVIVDRSLAIVAASRSVRARFGDRAESGASVTGLATNDAAFASAIRRVVASALAETIELELVGEPGHRFSFVIEPHPDGVALFGRAIRADTTDDSKSFDETFAVSRGAAVARIDGFGFLDGPHTALAALTGIGPAMLSTLRFVSLFAIPSRAVVADLIAAVEADGVPRSAPARLLTDSGDPREVKVALAPRRRAAAIDGVVALILATN